MLPPKRPPRANAPRSRLTAWLDRHAHPESRVSRYLTFAHSAIGLLGLAGLLALVVQLHEANVATRRDVYSQSVDAAILLEQLEFAHPDLICALQPDGPERRLEQSEMEVVRYLEMNLDLHERLWQQHQDGIFDEEEWDPWQRWFRDGVVTAEMFPAVWAEERDYYQQDFARYVDAMVADELAHRATATVAAGGTPSPPRTLADYADVGPAATPAC
jgi:hypothetical protein